MYHVFILFSRIIDTSLSGSFEPEIFGNAKYRTVFLKKYTYARYNYYSCKHLTFEFPPVWQRRRDFTSRIWSRDTHPADTQPHLSIHLPFPLFILYPPIDRSLEARLRKIIADRAQKGKGDFRVPSFVPTSSLYGYLCERQLRYYEREIPTGMECRVTSSQMQ